MATIDNNSDKENDFFLDKPFTFDRFIRLLLTISIVIGLILVIRSISNVLIPFFLALLLAYLTDPIVVVFQKHLKIKHRGLAVSITMLLFLGTIIGALWWLIPQFISEARKLAYLVKLFLETHSYKEFIPDGVEQWLSFILDNKQTQDFINAQGVKEVTVFILHSLRTVFTGSMILLYGVLGVFMIILYLFFILLDYKKIEQDWQNLIPVKFRPFAININGDLKKSMRVYFRAQISIAFIVGILLAIGFSIIELPMAISLGLFIGMLNIVPYLQVVGFIPAVLLALLKAMEGNTSVGPIILLVLLVIVVVQLIQELILIPKIMGKAYNMNPAIILLSLSVWGSIMGILGMLLALPLTTLIISYYKLFVLKPNDAIQVIDNNSDNDRKTLD